MNSTMIFFNGWAAIFRTFIAVVLTYLTMVVFLRISGKRTLSKMSAYDLIIPLTLGPIAAATILIPDVPILQGLFAFGLLVGLHTVMTWLNWKYPALRHLAKPDPALLVHEGEFLWRAMKRERVSLAEVQEVLRNEGLSSVKQARAVILEADGDYNVIPREYPELRAEDVDSLEECRMEA